MGLFTKLFGGGKGGGEPEGGGAQKAAAISSKTCPECQRPLLGSGACPFCKPQNFGEEMQEGTVSTNYKPQAGISNMNGVIVASQLAQQHGAKGFLHVYQGPNKGASVLLGTKVVTVGRKAEENMLALNDGGVSTKHCEVRPVHGGYQIVDIGSKNGTFINDKRVKEKALVNGDLIAFGNTRIYVGVF